MHGMRRLWLAVVAAVLLSLSWQNLIAVLHVHAEPVVGGRHLVAGGPTIIAIGTAQRSDDPATCPICRELAHSAHYLTSPPPLELGPPAMLAAVLIVSLALTIALQQRSHDWRSRAPPSPQA